MIKLLRLLSLLMCCMFFHAAQAQLVVTTQQQSGNPVAYYVNNVLLGTGVTAFNISFIGDSNQLAEFMLQNSGIDIAEGVLMATGNAQVAVGPNTSGSAGNAGTTNWHDPDLAALSGVSSNDGAILEFDFVPQGDTVSFNYVFSSEEYDEYTCSSVNDAFGFFLSGPGISGPFTDSAENIALVPGTDVPVSINTVNLGAAYSGSKTLCYALDSNFEANSIYYQQNQDDSTIQYDGHTVKLRAFHQVVCGDTYHIKLAIGDGGDQIFDSGVFLEAGSFSSKIIDVGITSVNGDSTVTEGCGAIEIRFSRSDLCLSAEVGLTYTGIAINGVDFPTLPDSIILEEGQLDSTILVQPIVDGLIEGPESFTITATRISTTGDTFISVGTFVILDSSNLLIATSPDTTLICRPDSIPLFAQVLVGGPAPYTYVWSTGQTGSNIMYIPPDSGIVDTVIVEVQDSCQLSTSRDTIIITGIYQPPVSVLIENDTLVNCVGDSLRLSTLIDHAEPPYSLQWSTGDTTDFIDIVVTGDTMYFITITDSCQQSHIDTAFIGIKVLNDFSVNLPDSLRFCEGYQLNLLAEASGAIEPYRYDWTLSNPMYGDTNYKEYIIQSDTVISVWVQDVCGRELNHLVAVDAVQTDPLVASLSPEEALCSGTEFDLTPEVEGGLWPFSYQWSTGDTDSVVVAMVSVTQYFTVTVSDGCGNVDTAGALIEIPKIGPMSLEVSGSTDLCFGKTYNVEVQAYGGAGGYDYEWSYALDPVPGEDYIDLGNGQYSIQSFQSNAYYFRAIDQCGNTKLDTVMINVKPCLMIPNIITPNNDGLNDAFYIENVTSFPDARLTVYNRWGQKVFDAQPYVNDWKPVDASEGVYYYILTSKYFNELRGDVTVLKD